MKICKLNPILSHIQKLFLCVMFIQVKHCILIKNYLHELAMEIYFYSNKDLLPIAESISK
jgi:hypothetical protein